MQTPADIRSKIEALDARLQIEEDVAELLSYL
jgi:hypothetical protein